MMFDNIIWNALRLCLLCISVCYRKTCKYGHVILVTTMRRVIGKSDVINFFLFTFTLNKLFSFNSEFCTEESEHNTHWYIPCQIYIVCWAQTGNAVISVTNKMQSSSLFEHNLITWLHIYLQKNGNKPMGLNNSAR